MVRGYRRKCCLDYTRPVSMRRSSPPPNESTELESKPVAQEPGASSQSSTSDLRPGEWVGEYVVTRKIGEGGFGTVYEALHPVIGKHAAVKVLHAQYSADVRVASRFAAEARAVNQIRHKNIVDIFSFGELPDGRQYYVMELLEGVPLDTYLDRSARLSLVETLTILSELAKALQAAHEAGIAHRDLKPENIFLEIDHEGLVHPKILDFGMAKLLAPGALPVHKTRSGTPIGSPRYMSPEQCRGSDVDPRTDVYAFGCIAFRMLAGVPPFEATTALELMMAHVSAPPVPLSSIGPDFGPAVDECLLRMLEKLPENRPQTVADAFDALRAAAATTDTDFSLPATLVASDLLRQLASERAQSTTESIDVSKVKRTPTKSQDPALTSARAWVWPIASISVAALVFWVLHSFSSHHDSAKPALPVDPAPPVSVVMPSASVPNSATLPEPTPDVTISVNTQPARAELYLNDKKVGVAPGPILVPKGDDTLTIQLKSPGFQPQTINFVPNGDQTLRVIMVPQKVRAAGNVSRDLENPY